VKSSLNKRHIEYAGAGAESVRQLCRTSAPVVYVEGRYKPKKPHRIRAGIITFSSDWRPPLGKPLQRTIKNLAPQKRLDFGCVLHEGAFAKNDIDMQVVVWMTERRVIIWPCLED
jgi:hypothetical protein